jgi:hypothetical protein
MFGKMHWRDLTQTCKDFLSKPLLAPTDVERKRTRNQVTPGVHSKHAIVVLAPRRLIFELDTQIHCLF